METLYSEQATVTTEPDFFDTKTAYAHKSNEELRQSFWLYRLMRSRSLVSLGSGLALWALKNKMPVKRIIRETLFRQFCGGETLEKAAVNIATMHRFGVDTVLDYAAEGAKTEADFNNTCQTVIHNIQEAGKFPGLSYISVKLTGLGAFELLEKISDGIPLDSAGIKAFRAVEERLDHICRTALEHGVTVYIDAEESWIQKPIDDLALTMMQRYNISRCVVMNTFQMYRQDRLAYIEYCIQHAEQEGFIAGIKLVRGAYLEKEQQRAAALHYPSPVFNQKVGTDKNFNAGIELCIAHLDYTALCIASHNEESNMLGVRKLYEKGISRYKDRVLFSQLFGMSDHITYNLARAGLHTSKYLPYGPVEIAMPYLLRRAQENTSVGKQTSRDLSLLSREIKRRRL